MALAPSVARLGSAELLIGKGSVTNGVVVVTYRLPADRHGRSQAKNPAGPGTVA